MVQGPPGTGKSSFISECFHQRIPPKAKVLVCTSTNKVWQLRRWFILAGFGPFWLV